MGRTRPLGTDRLQATLSPTPSPLFSRLPSSTYSRTEPSPSLDAIFNSGFCDKEDIKDLRPSDLLNEIHPLFAQENFAGELHRNYSVIKPPLRLTSLLLERALPIFHSIYFGTPRKEQSPWCSTESIGILPDPPQALTPEQESDTREMLSRLSFVCKFKLMDDDTHIKKGFLGVTSRSGKCAEGGPVPGYLSRITINNTAYKPLWDTYQSHDPPDYINELWHQFAFARILIHEIAQAIEYAAAWQVDYLTHFTHIFINQTSELGFEVEKYLFGGKIEHGFPYWKNQYLSNGVPSKLEGMIYMHDHPDPAHTYSHTKLAVFPAKNAQGKRIPPTQIQNAFCRWNVSMAWVASLFYRSFWSLEVPKALKPEKTTGFRFITGTGIHLGWDSLLYWFPEGYEISRYGLVYPAGQPPWYEKEAVEEAVNRALMGALPFSECG